MTRKSPTGRVLKNDYSSLLMLMAIGIMWILPIAGGVFGFLPRRRGGGAIEVDSMMMAMLSAMAVVVSILFGWLAIRRVGDIKCVIRTGPEIKGRIQMIWFDKDRGRVEYEYLVDGQAFQAGNAIWKNRETIKLREGDEIALIVDPQDSSRAFIASLYT